MSFSGWRVMILLLAGCSTTPDGGYVDSPNGRPVPVRQDRNTFHQLVKTDLDRLADIEYSENVSTLRLLMLKMYKRNPAEAQKSGLGTPEQIASYVFEQVTVHHWQFDALGGAQDTAAIKLALNAQYSGDRVLALVVGIQSMLFRAHGNKSAFFLTDSIEPQSLYNAARNIEIAVWKLTNAKNTQGELLLLTNSQPGEVQNLSFEREFSKLIARTDLLALTLAEKSQRFISRLTQSITTAPFLPFR
ncbi:hypothetical protein [Methylophilus sp. UBA6697]|jgi:hypothetical protein|uniref:hypothetical protein n=1 Tax=Methylophilus sp. UBA6697 TaxID=1946902 RepID=UPI0025FD5B34|nr:hypothetical protein [Methylophilus sp. UBA6697]